MYDYRTLSKAQLIELVRSIEVQLSTIEAYKECSK